MNDAGGRLALLTEEQLEVVLQRAAIHAARQVLEQSQPERGLKVSEVAERLSCAESTIYALVDRGKLPAVRLGSAIRVLESALNDWVRSEALPGAVSRPSSLVAPTRDRSHLRRGPARNRVAPLVM